MTPFHYDASVLYGVEGTKLCLTLKYFSYSVQCRSNPEGCRRDGNTLCSFFPLLLPPTADAPDVAARVFLAVLYPGLTRRPAAAASLASPSLPSNGTPTRARVA